MTIDFVSLHTHTCLGSMLDALNNVDALFEKVKSLGQKALAITDHGTMAAHYDAYKASQKTGVKFIPGCETYFVNSYATIEDSKKTERRKHLVLLAQNAQGYKNLLRANFIGFQNQVQVMGRIFPRINWDVLKKYNEGLICMSACANGPISNLLNEGEMEEAEKVLLKLEGIFGKRLFLEIQPHHLKNDNVDQKKINEGLIELSQKYGVGLVVGTDTHYLTREDEKYHDVLMAINSKKPVDDPDRHRYGIDDFYVKTGEEVFEFLNKHYGEFVAKEAVENTVNIANLCEEPKYIFQDKNHLPVFNPSEEEDYNEFLEWKSNQQDKGISEDKMFMRFRCIKGFKEKFSHMSKEDRDIRWKRVKKEIKVIEGNDFSSYMLIVSDFIRWAKKNSIMVGHGRGSSGGSLIAHLLDIHKVDPIEYGLLFERFQNAYKKDLPDIDTDFSSFGRDRVKEYCRKKYGEENCAQISNIMTYSPKSVIPSLVKSMRNVIPGLVGEGENYVRVSEFIKAAIPEQYDDEVTGEKKKVKTLEKALSLSPDLVKFSNRCPELMEYAKNIVGLPSTFSTHAAALIIADQPIVNIAPLRVDKDGVVAVQYEKQRCEALGLVKMDLLSISTLDVIDDTIKNILKLNPESKIKSSDDIPLNDEKTFEMIQKGNTKCVFQLGKSTMMMQLCKNLKPKNIVDIAIVNALGRPSSSKEERQEFIDRRFGKKPVRYLHPSLEESLKETYGLGIFEEQLLLIAQQVAGWDLNKADGLRKLTKLKGKDPKLAEQLEVEFIKGSMEKHNMSYEEALQIWEKIVLPFAKYGFNKCLVEETEVISSDGVALQIKEIKEQLKKGPVFLKSYDCESQSIINDECVEVIDAGEQDVYEITLSNGKTIECTEEHKFLCIDDKMHTVKEIIDFDLELKEI